MNLRQFPPHVTRVIELLQAAIAPHQILFTLLLTLVVLYWLLVIFGALAFDGDLPEGLTEADADSAPDAHGFNTGGAWLTAGRVIGLSQVPIVVWLSFTVLFLWFFSLVLNHLWNPENGMGRALALLLPNAIASAVATKLVTLPVAKLFRAMADADTEAEEVIGRTGTVCSIEADERYGQLEIAGTGAPLLVNVRVQPGARPLQKGDTARVTAAGTDAAFYFIEPA